MTTRNSTLVGVFNDRAQAENAIEQLHSAGIPDEQISYSGGAGGGFLAGIKSLFTGEDTAHTGLVGDLTGMGLSQDEANYYDSEYRAGRYIVAVNPGSRWQDAQTGEARLRMDVVEEQQNIDVPFNREEVIVQRQSYGEDRPTDLPVGQDETIRVPVSEEQVNVNKQTVETGEVGVGKRVVQDQQRVSDTVRREEANLETNGNARVRDANADQSTTYNNPDPNYNNPDPNQNNY